MDQLALVKGCTDDSVFTPGHGVESPVGNCLMTSVVQLHLEAVREDAELVRLALPRVAVDDLPGFVEDARVYRVNTVKAANGMVHALFRGSTVSSSQRSTASSSVGSVNSSSLRGMLRARAIGSQVALTRLPNGLCYLKMAKSAHAESLVSAVGKWPTVAKLLARPRGWFMDRDSLSVLRVRGEGIEKHVSARKAGEPLVEQLELAAKGRLWPAGSLGEELAAKFPNASESDAVSLSAKLGGSSEGSFEPESDDDEEDFLEAKKMELERWQGSAGWYQWLEADLPEAAKVIRELQWQLERLRAEGGMVEFAESFKEGATRRMWASAGREVSNVARAVEKHHGHSRVHSIPVDMPLVKTVIRYVQGLVGGMAIDAPAATVQIEVKGSISGEDREAMQGFKLNNEVLVDERLLYGVLYQAGGVGSRKCQVTMDGPLMMVAGTGPGVREPLVGHAVRFIGTYNQFRRTPDLFVSFPMGDAHKVRYTVIVLPGEAGDDAPPVKPEEFAVGTVFEVNAAVAKSEALAAERKTGADLSTWVEDLSTAFDVDMDGEELPGVIQGGSEKLEMRIVDLGVRKAAVVFRKGGRTPLGFLPMRDDDTATDAAVRLMEMGVVKHRSVFAYPLVSGGRPRAKLGVIARMYNPLVFAGVARMGKSAGLPFGEFVARFKI